MNAKPGDRVLMRYGPGTVTRLEPDTSGRRPALVWVVADIGQAWLCEQAELRPLNEAHEQLAIGEELETFDEWIRGLNQGGGQAR